MQQEFIFRDSRTVKKRRDLAARINAELEKLGFEEGYVPALYPMSTSFPRSGIDDRIKLVDSDGKVMCVSDDTVTGLLQTADGTLTRLYGMAEQYKLFGEVRNEACYAAVITGLGGIEAEAEMISAGVRIAEKLGISVSSIVLSHTDVMQGVVENIRKKKATKADIAKLIAGEIDNEDDLEASKFLQEIAAANGGIGVIGEIAEKITNKTSVDGLVTLFELSKVLDEYGFNEKVSFDLSGMGRDYDNGIVFAIYDDGGNKIIEGGRHDYMSGSDMRRAVSLRLFPDYITSIHQELVLPEEKFDVALGVADGIKSLKQAYKLKNGFAEEGLRTSVLYKVSKEDTASYAAVFGIESAVYVEENGNILYQ